MKRKIFTDLLERENGIRQHKIYQARDKMLIKDNELIKMEELL